MSKSKKCYSCRKDKPDDGKLFCKKCEKDPAARKHTAGTYVIYDKV